MKLGNTLVIDESEILHAQRTNLNGLFLEIIYKNHPSSAYYFPLTESKIIDFLNQFEAYLETKVNK